MAKMTEEQKLARAEAKKAQKAADEKQALIDRQRNFLLGQIDDLRKKPLPVPKYRYQVGEEVKPRTAHWDKVVITEVLDDGKILRCNITSTNENYGNPKQSTNERIISHLDVIPLNLSTETDFLTKDKVEMRFSQRDIDGLLSLHYSFGVDFSPSYQRELCWSQEDKEKLIESIFKRVDIGKFAFIHLSYKPNSPNYEILDGKQRLSTLIEFYEDKFTYKGKYYSELSRGDKTYFGRHLISFGTSEDRTEWTLKDKVNYFLKLNTAGVPQSEEHLKKLEELLKTLKD